MADQTGKPASIPDSIPPSPPAREAPQGPPADAAPRRAHSGRPPVTENTRLGRVIQVRIDRVLQDAIQEYMVANHMTVSQALRVLITLGLDQERSNPDAVFHAAAFREGLMQGLGTVNDKVFRAVHKALAEVAEEAGDGA